MIARGLPASFAERAVSSDTRALNNIKDIGRHICAVQPGPSEYVQHDCVSQRLSMVDRAASAVWNS